MIERTPDLGIQPHEPDKLVGRACVFYDDSLGRVMGEIVQVNPIPNGVTSVHVKHRGTFYVRQLRDIELVDTP